MLAIRLQRTGRKGHAQYRLIAQDSRFAPNSGRVVAYLGSYNPHTKEAILNTEKLSTYLSNGAQPSETAAKLLKKEGVKLPDWVKVGTEKKRDIKNPEKLRRNRPADAEVPVKETGEAPEEVAAETSAEEPAKEETPAAEDPTATKETSVADETPTES